MPRIEVHLYLHPSEKGILDTLHELLITTKTQGTHIMATLQELKDAIAQVSTDIAAEKAEVQALLKDLRDKVAALEAQIAQGGVISQADLDALKASIDAIDVGVKDISEPAVPTP